MEPVWAWRVLGLPPGSSAAEVRRAFRLAAQLLHPDRVTGAGSDLRAEAQRRMAELAEAHRVCSAVATGAPPPPPRFRPATDQGAHRTLRPVGGRAAELLAEAQRTLATVAPWTAYRGHGRTLLSREENVAASRLAVTTLEHVADGWPGTAEGDEARGLLVTSVAAHNSLSARERAGHLVLVMDADTRDLAWESLRGRDELAVAQVVYGHPTAAEHLRQRARDRLAELDDWATLADDPDPDVRRSAEAEILLRESLSLAGRAAWLSRRERAGFDAELAAWRRRVTGVVGEALPTSLRQRLSQAEAEIAAALAPVRARAAGADPAVATVLAVTAVDSERDAVADGIGAPQAVRLGPYAARRCETDGADVLVVAGGVGPAAAAAAATGMALQPVTLLVSIGVAGAFSSASLKHGDLVIASTIVAADLGAMSPERFLDLGALGLDGGAAVRCAPELVALAEQRLQGGGPTVAVGPVLTVSTATGTVDRAEALMARHGAVAEAMEGAGVAHVAVLHEAPVLEVRAVSNQVGDRDRESWDLLAALDSLGQAARRLLRTPLEG